MSKLWSLLNRGGTGYSLHTSDILVKVPWLGSPTSPQDIICLYMSMQKDMFIHANIPKDLQFHDSCLWVHVYPCCLWFLSNTPRCQAQTHCCFSTIIFLLSGWLAFPEERKIDCVAFVFCWFHVSPSFILSHLPWGSNKCLPLSDVIWTFSRKPQDWAIFISGTHSIQGILTKIFPTEMALA